MRDRVPILDSLRGVAILSVFAYHAFFWNGVLVDGWLSRAVTILTRPAWLGVDLFFVLSGFLITGRLLDRRDDGAGDYYKGFYARRALRILPLYFTILLVVGSIMWRTGETSWQFLAASVVFLPNIALLAGWWSTGPLAVLWSLGVEEQVYLVWPFLVRVLPSRGLPWLMVAVGLVEPFLRYATFTAGWLREGLSIATWLRLDGFAWGALLAIAIRDPHMTRRRLGAIGLGTLIMSVGLAAFCASTDSLSQRTVIGTSLQLACADLFFAGLIAVSLWRTWGDAKPAAPHGGVLASFGRISYCLYLVHMFVFWSFDRLAGISSPMALAPTVLRAVIVLAVSTALAELSWRYIEGPSLQFKPAFLEPAVVKSA
jgi:peptidoglycan/LPS O-acetylase OafA/YrhL